VILIFKRLKTLNKIQNAPFNAYAMMCLIWLCPSEIENTIKSMQLSITMLFYLKTK